MIYELHLNKATIKKKTKILKVLQGYYRCFILFLRPLLFFANKDSFFYAIETKLKEKWVMMLVEINIWI